MHEQDPALNPNQQPQPAQLSDALEAVEQKQFSAAVLKSPDDIQRYIETPAIPAVTNLWEKNVPSVQSNANGENVTDTPTAWIDFDYDNLSDANKAVVNQSEIISEYTEQDGRRIVKLGFDMTDMTPTQVSEGLAAIAEEFQPQPLVRGVHTVEDVAKMYFCEPSEVTAEFVAETGMVLGDDGRVYESQELYQNQLAYEAGANEEPNQEQVLQPENLQLLYHLEQALANEPNMTRFGDAIGGALNTVNRQEQSGTEVTLAKIAVINVALGASANDQSKRRAMYEFAGPLLQQLQGIEALSAQEISMIQNIMTHVSDTNGNLNTVSGAITSLDSLISQKRQQGEDVKALEVATFAFGLGASKDFNFKGAMYDRLQRLTQ